MRRWVGKRARNSWGGKGIWGGALDVEKWESGVLKFRLAFFITRPAVCGCRSRLDNLPPGIYVKYTVQIYPPSKRYPTKKKSNRFLFYLISLTIIYLPHSHLSSPPPLPPPVPAPALAPPQQQQPDHSPSPWKRQSRSNAHATGYDCSIRR